MKWLIASFVVSLLFIAVPTYAFTLSTPKPGAEVASGELLVVVIEKERDANLQDVKFYWYRYDEEPVASHQAKPAAFHLDEAGAAFSGRISVPTEALGVMRLLAVGEISRGRLTGHQDFDEVFVTAKPKADLTAVEFAVEKPWKLDMIGKRLPIPAVGQFADEGVRSLCGPGSGSEFGSSDEQVVSIDADGMMQVKGNGKAVITVRNRGKEGRLTVLVNAEVLQNQEPVARVPADLTVKSGHLVVLDGLQSRDPDGDPLHYEWKQVRGNKVALMNSNEAKATFMAPIVTRRRQLQFVLQVTDMAGPDTVKGADSRPAVVSVWVDP